MNNQPTMQVASPVPPILAARWSSLLLHFVVLPSPVWRSCWRLEEWGCTLIGSYFPYVLVPWRHRLGCDSDDALKYGFSDLSLSQRRLIRCPWRTCQASCYKICWLSPCLGSWCVNQGNQSVRSWCSNFAIFFWVVRWHYLSSPTIWISGEEL